MTLARPLACLTLFMLAACGADPAPGPVEQIVVREPGGAPVAIAAAAVADNPASVLIAEGKAAFANCSVCHTAERGAANRAGPNLFGVVGKPAGRAAGFAYSDGLKTSGIVWTAAELDRFIANPSARIPGTKMIAGGISDAAKRQAVIAYLESLTAS